MNKSLFLIFILLLVYSPNAYCLEFIERCTPLEKKIEVDSPQTHILYPVGLATFVSGVAFLSENLSGGGGTPALGITGILIGLSTLYAGKRCRTYSAQELEEMSSKEQKNAMTLTHDEEVSYKKRMNFFTWAFIGANTLTNLLLMLEANKSVTKIVAGASIATIGVFTFVHRKKFKIPERRFGLSPFVIHRKFVNNKRVYKTSLGITGSVSF